MKNDLQDTGNPGTSETAIVSSRPPVIQRAIPSWLTGWLSALFVLLWLSVMIYEAKGFSSNNREAGLTDDSPAISQSRGTLRGIVVDKNSDAPLGHATVFIPDLRTGTQTHGDGTFILRNLAAGTYTIQARHVGYQAVTTAVHVVADDTTTIEFRLQESVFRSAGVVITGDRSINGTERRVDHSLGGQALRRELSRTISETLRNEPGLAEQSMGPAPARPVLRGLSGERLEILEDGARTGDLSGMAEDHAVAIEPLTAREIEIIRGPSALLYTSNAMGGIINVIREKVPLAQSEHHHGSASFNAESVNAGFAGGFSATGPLSDKWAYYADGTIRNARDIQTPSGSLMNTGIRTYSSAAGFSRFTPWGLAGLSLNYYRSDYGIPGDREVRGLHPNGVDISMERFYADGTIRLGTRRTGTRFYELSTQLSHYIHTESPGGRPDVVAAKFGVLAHNLKITAPHNGLLGISTGTSGIWWEYRFQQTGGSVFTPDTMQFRWAGFTHDRYSWDRIQLDVGLRFDALYFRPMAPHELVNVRLMLDQLDFPADYKVTDRFLYGLAGSASLYYHIRPDWEAGVILLRSIRLPGIEELSQDGPHLGAYSFEVGNPALKTERAYGVEIQSRYTSDQLRFNISVFRTQANHFIFSSQIADRAPRHAPLPLYQYRGDRVLLSGVELHYELPLWGKWVTSGTASYVQGDIIPQDRSMPLLVLSGRYEHLPQIPPFNGHFDLEYRLPRLTVGGRMHWAFSQSRTGRFEQSTSGYQTGHFFAETRIWKYGMYHTVSLNVGNAFDTRYFNHLNRIREIMPEPGRNFRLLYRAYF